MKEIAKQQLDDALKLLTVEGQGHTAIQSELFYTLYHTGCRPVEVFNTPHWFVSPSGHIHLFAAKRNRVRKFDLDQISPGFYLAIESGSTYWHGVTKYSASDLLRKYLPYPTLMVKGKPINLYLFRHLYIWRLLKEGLERDDVIDHMGWKYSKSFESYQDSIIYQSD